MSRPVGSPGSRSRRARSSSTARNGAAGATPGSWQRMERRAPMLSRAATSLTLLGRHLERADNLARILGVHVALSLDRTDEPGPEFWMRFMELAGWRGSDTNSRDQAIEVVITGTLGPSVRASVAAARVAAQAVRPSLPTELYEQVNALHWRGQGGRRPPDPSSLPPHVEVRLHG